MKLILIILTICSFIEFKLLRIKQGFHKNDYKDELSMEDSLDPNHINGHNQLPPSKSFLEEVYSNDFNTIVNKIKKSQANQIPEQINYEFNQIS